MSITKEVYGFAAFECVRQQECGMGGHTYVHFPFTQHEDVAHCFVGFEGGPCAQGALTKAH